MNPIDPIVPGELILHEEPVALFEGRERMEIEVVNTGDRPIQVGSHYHFAEANPALSFDRAAARGFHLAIPSGTAVRFEPGIGRVVELVALGGRRVVRGLRGAVAGPLDADSPRRTSPSPGSGPGEPSQGDI